MYILLHESIRTTAKEEAAQLPKLMNMFKMEFHKIYKPDIPTSFSDFWLENSAET